MFLPHSFGLALLMMLAGMICWGSWANAYKLTPTRRFELFYWDYVAGTFLLSLLAALTLGSLFGGDSFARNFLAAGLQSKLFALLAGVTLNFGNILLLAGVSLVGMSVAFPISLGLSLVVSTVLSYLITPRGDAAWLFSGVTLVFFAVVLNSFAYRSRGAVEARASMKGILICIASGVSFCAFAPLVTKSFAARDPIGPYGAAVMFTAGAFLSTFPFMSYFMRRPLDGPPIGARDFWASTSKEHTAGMLGGAIWGSGTVLTFAAADFVGMALAGAIGQANSLVAAVWGVFVWREFRGAPARSRMLLALMFVCYVGGIACIARSHDHQDPAQARFQIVDEAARGPSTRDLVVLHDRASGIEASIAPDEGGELSRFRVLRQGTWLELIHRAGDYSETAGWRGKSPILWPATGRNFAFGVTPRADLDAVGAYNLNGNRYPMPIHGFARQLPWTVEERTASGSKASLRLNLQDSASTRKFYPFSFHLSVTYALEDGELSMEYTVAAGSENTGPMPFSIGNHLTLNVPFVPGGDAGLVTLETPSTVEYIKDANGLPTGASRPRSEAKPTRLADLDATTAVSLGGYSADPWLRLHDPAGLTLLIKHHARSLPAPPVVQFNLWGDPRAGYFSPEPWVGLQNSLVLRHGIIELPPGQSWDWTVILRPERFQVH